MDEELILQYIMSKPQLLKQNGLTYNTWRLILNDNKIPQLDIKYALVNLNGTTYELIEFDGLNGYTDEGDEIDISSVDVIYEIDATVSYETSLHPKVKIIQDVVYHPHENRYVTLYYFLHSNVTPRMVNALPLFDHTQIIYRFKDKIVKGIFNYPNLIEPFKIYNRTVKSSPNGMVRVAYDIEVPYSVFFNKVVNSELESYFPVLPLIEHCFSISF